MPTPDDGGTWGILGGTFDPIHSGHLNLAAQVREKCQLAGVLFVPAYRHPFKGDQHSPYEDRVEMLRLALRKTDDLLLCEIEEEQQLPGHSLTTVRALKMRYPKAVFSFIVGQDILSELDNWHRPAELLAETPMLVGVRPPHDIPVPRGIPTDRIEMVAISPVEVSATDLRNQLATVRAVEDAPEVVREALTADVVDYIVKRGLYR